MTITAKLSDHARAEQTGVDCVVVFLPGAPGDATAGPIVARLPEGNVAGYTVRGVRQAIANTTVLPLVAGQLGKILSSVRRQHPGSDLLLLQAGVQMPDSWRTRINACLEQNPEIAALSAFNNISDCYNPFAGISPVIVDDAQLDPDSLVAVCGNNTWFADMRWPQGFVYLPAASLAQFADDNLNPVSIIDRFSAAGRHLAILDSLFAWHPGLPLNGAGSSGQSHPVAARQTGVISCWLKEGVQKQARVGLDARPVNLHITHSWGGGVARWISDFSTGDRNSHNLVLASEQENDGREHTLSLYMNTHIAPVARWLLQPAISDSVTCHEQYRQILKYVTSRYGVGRLIISSLIGHSLDALDSGLPTVQVMHDYYPHWPLLGVNPLDYLLADGTISLENALDDTAGKKEFPPHDPDHWQRLQQKHLKQLRASETLLVAPSQATVDLIRQLQPGFSEFEIRVQPHGLNTGSAVSRQASVRPSPDGRLRLVILGRIQEGKGKALLQAVLPELTELAQVYLLGSGKDGEDFFGQSGVSIICQYDYQQLPDLLEAIAPQAGLLLSTTPETFSYTLSELFHYGIPPIATRLGSFPERINHGKNGFLFDAGAKALLDLLRVLNNEPAKLDKVRNSLQKIELTSSDDMVAAYNQWLPAAKAAPPVVRRISNQGLQLASLSGASLKLQRAISESRKELASQKKELLRRANWGLDLQRDIKQLHVSITALEDHATNLETELGERTKWALLLDQELNEYKTYSQQQAEQIISQDQQLAFQLEQNRKLGSQAELLENRLEQVMGSRSWRLTRPLRLFNRLLANAITARLFNPLLWPYLLRRFLHNVAINGLKNTLLRMQSQSTHAVSTPPVLLPVPVIEEKIRSLSFPASLNPMVSIIIPVHNQYAYTQACLSSLLDCSNNVPFEVIVVDDASTDRTAELLESTEGVTAIHNDTNLGFIGTCNRGAEAANGEYLVFLNNDTIVTDHWLDRLLATFSTFPDCGITGARLLYPDGSLQEAGGIIFRDGSGWNYGRNQDAADPRYQFAREVDYVSGACLAISREFFTGLGGFDSHYAPAYYEDTDLAFKCRKAGKTVMVQPQASVIHFEGITGGTDLSQGVKRYQEINQEKFTERWQKELLQQPAEINNPDDQAEVRAAAEHYSDRGVLVIDAYTPEPDQDSGSMRLRNLLLCLRQLGFHVTFMADNRGYAGNYTTELQAIGIEVIYEPWLKNMLDFFEQRGPGFDVIMVSRHYIAEKYIRYARHYCPHAHFIFDTVDLHYLREERLAELENRLPLRRAAAQTKSSELKLIKAADATVVVSKYEQQVLNDAAPGAKIQVVSNIHPVMGCRNSYSARRDLFFVGGYQHPPNIDAAVYLAEEIYPLIRAQLPEVRCYLIGSKAPDAVRSLDGDGIIFRGFVDNLEPFLDGCRLAVAPLRYGAGVKGKVNMSMAYGQPVVASPAAVEGLHAEHGKEILVADTPEAFAAEVIRLYQDEKLWNELSKAGLKNVAEHFSFAAARKNLADLLADLDKSALTGTRIN